MSIVVGLVLVWGCGWRWEVSFVLRRLLFGIFMGFIWRVSRVFIYGGCFIIIVGVIYRKLILD